MKSAFLTTTAVAATATALTFTPVPEAEAGLIEYKGTAEVEWTDGGNVATVFQPGDKINFLFSFDDGLTDSAAPDFAGRYDPASLQMTFDTATGIISDENAIITVLDGQPDSLNFPTGTYPTTIDRFLINAQDPLAFEQDGLPNLLSASVILEDYTGGVFSSDALPTHSDLADFDRHELYFTFAPFSPSTDPSDYGRMRAEMTSLDTKAVPEPGTALLIGAGIVGLGFAASRKKDSEAPSAAPANDDNGPSLSA